MFKQNITYTTPLNINYEDAIVDQMLRECDEEIMALPDLESEPHLLITKVRKHYMEYMVKLLSTNYETNQKLLNKNIYLPSAIWRCAKEIEMKAAQACMVVQIYRKNFAPVIKELKNDTKRGKLNRKLFDCLSKPPTNFKKTQTAFTFNEKDYNCHLVKRKRKSRSSVSPELSFKEKQPAQLNSGNSSFSSHSGQQSGPLNTSFVTATPQHIPTYNGLLPPYQIEPQPLPLQNPIQNDNTFSILPNRLSIESEDTDEVMLQLEKLFHEETDMASYEGDIFDKWDTVLEENAKKNASVLIENNKNTIPGSVIETHTAQIRSLDERLASLAGLLVHNDPPTQQPKTDIAPPIERTKKIGSSKWICEEYFLKQKYFEKLDQIGETNRLKLGRIKDTIVYLFGYDSDDDQILSPLDETPEFIVSCKERIAPWVVKLLTPYYMKGNIKGKGVFKALAKHLIRLIYQCSQYPEQYEVHSFIKDFLKNHRSIRSEADFKEFRIENI